MGHTGGVMDRKQRRILRRAEQRHRATYMAEFRAYMQNKKAEAKATGMTGAVRSQFLFRAVYAHREDEILVAISKPSEDVQKWFDSVAVLGPEPGRPLAVPIIIPVSERKET